MDKLGVYNLALALVEEPRLATLTDDIESRYALDEHWETAYSFVFEDAAWEWAAQTKEITNSGTTAIGYDYQYDLPTKITGFVSLIWASNQPLGWSSPIDYELSINSSGNRELWCNYNPIYVRSVIIQTDPTRWPVAFAKTVAAYLAYLICGQITGDTSDQDKLLKIYDADKGEALSNDVSQKAVRRLNEGSWSKSRRGYYPRNEQMR
jgi:hypothetical protein